MPAKGFRMSPFGGGGSAGDSSVDSSAIQIKNNLNIAYTKTMPIDKKLIAQAIKDGKVVDKTTLANFIQNEELKQKMAEEYPALKKVLEQIKGDKGDKGEQGIQGEKGEDGDKGETGERGLQGIEGQKGDKGETGKSGNDGITPDVSAIALDASKQAIEAVKPLIPDIKQIEDQLPQLGEEIRDSLELLTGEERLDASAIKGLDDKIKREGTKHVWGPVAGDYKYTKYHGGGSNLTVSATQPANPELFDLWYDVS